MPVYAAVYDILGREVVRLCDGEIFSPGRHVLHWNGQEANGQLTSAGMYFYRLQAGERLHTAKVLLLP
jgi:hypothetical protein